MTTLARVRARYSQSWSVYGRPIRHSEGLQRVVGHAARTRSSKWLLASHLNHLVRRPSRHVLPRALGGVLEDLLGPPSTAAVTWLVHERVETGRTIVHEIDGSGLVLSVVKVGRAADVKFRHERQVIASLDKQHVDRDELVVVPELLAMGSDESTSAIRTRLDLADVVAPPYAWRPRTFDAAMRAIGGLHELLSGVITSASPSALSSPDGAEPPEVGTWDELVPSHGDLTAWNLFLLGQRPTERFAVIDFEECALRPRWWDAARLLTTLLEEGRVPDSDLPTATSILGIGRIELADFLALGHHFDQLGGPTERRTRRLVVLEERLRGDSW